ncbi:MAG: hypothetical protein ACOCVD_02555 [Bacillota bacterium]
MTIRNLAERLPEEQVEIMNLIMDIEDLTPTDDNTIGWERKIVCPSCYKKTLLLKSNSKTGAYYKCLECGKTGDLLVLYHDLLGKSLLVSEAGPDL